MQDALEWDVAIQHAVHKGFIWFGQPRATTARGEEGGKKQSKWIRAV